MRILWLSPILLAAGEAGAMATGSSLAYLVGNLGAVGVLAWYAIYTTKHTLPSIHDQYREDLQSILDAHSRAIDSINAQRDRERAFFHESLERILKSHHEALGEIKQAVACRDDR